MKDIELDDNDQSIITIGDFVINLSLNDEKDLVASFARDQDPSEDNPDSPESPNGAFEDFVFSRKNIHDYE
jgi:hypothetical protein